MWVVDCQPALMKVVDQQPIGEYGLCINNPWRGNGNPTEPTSLSHLAFGAWRQDVLSSGPWFPHAAGGAQVRGTPGAGPEAAHGIGMQQLDVCAEDVGD